MVKIKDMEIERRITHRLVDYWQRIKGDRVLPSEIDIDSDDVADMWPDCFILQIHDVEDLTRAHAYTFTFVGKNLSSLYTSASGEHDGLLSVLDSEHLMGVVSEMQMTKLPVVEQVEAFPHQGSTIKYRMCLLPLGNESGKINGILGGLRYKTD